jgi:hypothetical protein
MLFRLLATSALAAGCAASALGQTQKGQSFYTGTIAFSRETQDQLINDDQGNPRIRTSTSRATDATVRAGWFIRDNLAVGLGLSYVNKGPENVILRPFLRYYRPLGERFKVFLQTEATYSIKKDPYLLYDLPGKYGLNAGLGLVYFAHKRLAIEASTGLLSVGFNRYDTNQNTGYSLNGGINLNSNVLGLGIAYYVGANPAPRTPFSESALTRGTRFLGGSVSLGGNSITPEGLFNRLVAIKKTNINFDHEYFIESVENGAPLA